MESMWIAARVERAHTSPVYVTVDERRHWNQAAAGKLFEARLRILDEVGSLIDAHGTSIRPGILGRPFGQRVQDTGTHNLPLVLHSDADEPEICSLPMLAILAKLHPETQRLAWTEVKRNSGVHHVE